LDTDRQTTGLTGRNLYPKKGDRMAGISKEDIRKLLKVYFIMGSNNCVKDPLEVVAEALQGGATLFQLREKGKGAFTGEQKKDFAKKVQNICKEYGVPFIVNDDVDLAIELDADGVHIGQEDESAISVRKRIGNKILGVSTHNLEEVQAAIHAGADYVGVGPIFATTTKEDAKEVQGTALLRLLREKGIDIPVVGIGGINAKNAAQVVAAGADGVSVISAISMADSPLESTKQLREAVWKNK
jgi:thiamine-phosphate pyrophosphorylase